MSYVYLRFGSTFLPYYDPDQDIGTGSSRLDIVPLPGGGFFDALGDQQAPREPTKLSGKALILAETPAELRNAFASLRAMRGKRDKLFRKHGGTGDLEWCYARCNEIRATRRPATPLTQEVEFSFQMLSPSWFGLRHSTGWLLDDGLNLDDGLAFDEGAPIPLVPGSQEVTLLNEGNADNHQLVLTIVAGSGSITKVTIQKVGETDISFNGSLFPAQSLIIDAGARSIIKQGADAYNDFSIGPGHSIGKWLKLVPGANTFTITLNGGGSGSRLYYTYYDAWE